MFCSLISNVHQKVNKRGGKAKGKRLQNGAPQSGLQSNLNGAERANVKRREVRSETRKTSKEGVEIEV